MISPSTSFLVELRRGMRWILCGFLLFSCGTAVAGTSYTSTIPETAWNTKRWMNPGDSSYGFNFISGNDVAFTITPEPYKFPGMGTTINVGNVTLADNVTVNFTGSSGSFGTGGQVRTFDIGTGATLNFKTQGFNAISGTGYVKNGNGVLALQGGSYNGGFTLNAGTVVLRDTNAMGDGGKLTISGGTIAASANVSLSSKFDNGIDVLGNFTLGSTTPLANPTATISFYNTMDLKDGNRTITIGGDADYTLSSAISNGALTVDAIGTGKLFLSGTSNTYTGGTTLNSGTLVLNTNALPDTGAVTVNGGELQLGVFGNRNDTVGAVTLSGGKLYGNSGVLTGSSYNLQSGQQNAVLGGTAALTKTTSGTVTLNGIGMTYTGGTTITDGVLQLQNSNQLPNTGTIQITGGTLDMDNFPDTVGPVVLAGGTLTGTAYSYLQGSSYDVQSGTIGVQLKGNFSPLTKNGPGTVIITSANNYGGITTLNDGTLAVAILAGTGVNSGIGAAYDAMPVRLAFDGGELEYTGASVGTNRGFTLNAGGGAIDVAANSTTLSWTGEATGSGALTKNGNGTLELTFENTYTGGTVVNAGTLAVNNTGTGSGTGSGPVNIAGGTLIGSGILGGNLSVQSGGTVNPGNSIGTLEVDGNATFNGKLLVEVSSSGAGLVDLLDGIDALAIESGSTVDFSLLDGPLDDPAYVFATYTSQTGRFSHVRNLPAGYTIDYAFNGNSLALVPVPEPASLAMLLLGGLGLLGGCLRRYRLPICRIR